MQIPSPKRIALLAVVLGTAGLSAMFARAQSNDNTDSTTPSTQHQCHFHGSVLTADEKAELKKDYQEALANDASLKAAQESLKAQEKALHEQAEAFHQKLDAAMVSEDASVQAILDKLNASHKKWHHHHGFGDDSSTTTTNP